MNSAAPLIQGRARPWRALRLRFLVFVVLAVPPVALIVEQIGDRFTEQALEDDAIAAAGAAGLGVAEDIQDQQTPPTVPELDQLLIDYRALVPTLRSLSVVVARGKAFALISTTQPQPGGDLEGLAARATTRRAPVVETTSSGPGFLRLVAAPLEKAGRAYGAVVVGISLDAVTRTHDRIRRAQYLLVFVSTLLIAAVLDLFAQHLVFAPLRALRDTMKGSLEKERGLRTPVVRDDEIGDVARAFNEMRTRIEGFSDTLEAEVARATATVAERNVDLRRSVEQLFEARRELAQSEMLAATGQMAATFAHQIGTPLALISGYVQLLQTEAERGSEREERLRTVNEQVGRVTTIVRDLMAQTRTPLLRLQPTDAATLLMNIARLVRPSAALKSVSVEVDAGSALLPLKVDPGQMEQVFLNLVTNALDAMARGGRLTLRARMSEGGVRFEVEDTGTGIAPEVKPRIFDPLFTTKAPGRGTGLGLPIVRDVVHAHGGTVEVHSEEGEGARFVVVLPPGLVESGGAGSAVPGAA